MSMALARLSMLLTLIVSLYLFRSLCFALPVSLTLCTILSRKDPVLSLLRRALPCCLDPQEAQAIRRNFPVLGNVRYFLESIRPEIRQYLIESDTEAVPFSRQHRSLVYQRAKNVAAPHSSPEPFPALVSSFFLPIVLVLPFDLCSDRPLQPFCAGQSRSGGLEGGHGPSATG